MYELKKKNPRISDIMWEDYCLMSVYDSIHENSPITLMELARKINATKEVTERYITELERLGLIETEDIPQSDSEKIIKLKKDFLTDKEYSKIAIKMNEYLKH